MSPLQLPGADAPYRVLEEAEVARIQELRRGYPQGKSAILPALWILQRREGILTAEGMREVARALEHAAGAGGGGGQLLLDVLLQAARPLHRRGVHQHLLPVLRGSGKVLDRFGDSLGAAPGQTGEDGLATLLEVECLGACGGAPAAQVNHRFFESLTVEKVDGLVAEMRAGTLRALAAPGANPGGGDGMVALHELPTGIDAAGQENLVDLANPGANRMPATAGGAAGTVLDLVKGHGNLVAGREHPAERGYTELPSGAQPASTDTEGVV